MMPTPWQRTVTTRVVSGEQKNGRSEKLKKTTKRTRVSYSHMIVVVLQCRGTFQWRQHQQGAVIFQWQQDRIIPFEASGTPHSEEQQSRESSPEHVSHVDPSAPSGKIALTHPRMPRLIWVFAGRTFILLVLSCRGSHWFLKLHKRRYKARFMSFIIIIIFNTLFDIPLYNGGTYCRGRISPQQFSFHNTVLCLGR